MTTKKIPTVFIGSGPVAAASLQLLIPDFGIEAIITKPATLNDMRGIVPGMPIHVAASRRELDGLMAHTTFHSQLAILIDYGVILSKRVISSFKHGIINSHFSLLPQWRGADPITFAILSGQPQTGVSLMLLTEGMDEGPLLGQAVYDIPAGATTPQLTEKLIGISAASLKALVPLYIEGKLVPAPQIGANVAGNNTVSYSHKLNKEDGLIDWNKPAAQLEREVRAFIEWPKSRTILAGKEVIITKASVRDIPGKPGEVIIGGKQLVVSCGEQSLEIERLKPAGKAEMDASAFLAGYRHLMH